MCAGVFRRFVSRDGMVLLFLFRDWSHARMLDGNKLAPPPPCLRSVRCIQLNERSLAVTRICTIGLGSGLALRGTYASRAQAEEDLARFGA